MHEPLSGTLPPPKLAYRTSTMPRSAIRQIMALAAGRPEVLHLEVGEPDFSTPEAISAAAFEAVRGGATRYTPNAGTLSLRKAIADRTNRKFETAISADAVVVTTGAIGSLFSAMFAILDPGDEVLIPDPGWPNYKSIAHIAGATAVPYVQPAERGFLPDLEEIAALITPRTKAIIINTPGNPTGAIFDSELMRGIGQLVSRQGLYLISDEVYEDFVFEGEHVSALQVAPLDRTLVVSGVSKSFAMTGWRLGWLIAPPEVAALAASLQEPVTSCPPAPSQAAAEAALAIADADVKAFCEVYRKRRDVLLEVFSNSPALPAVPHGAFYAFLDIGASKLTSLEFARRLIEREAVAAVPGETFGATGDRFLRVAFTIEEMPLREALRRVRRMIEGGTT